MKLENFPWLSMVAIFILVAIATLIHSQLEEPKHKELFGFAATGLSVGAALLGAIYVGTGLTASTEHLRQSLEAERVNKAFYFFRRWNDSSFSTTVTKWIKVKEKLSGKSTKEIVVLLDTDNDTRTTVMAMLNFFEELALASAMGLADDEMLKRFFRTLAIDTFELTSGWITEFRLKNNRDSIWREFQALYHQWMLAKLK